VIDDFSDEARSEVEKRDSSAVREEMRRFFLATIFFFE